MRGAKRDDHGGMRVQVFCFRRLDLEGGQTREGDLVKLLPVRLGLDRVLAYPLRLWSQARAVSAGARAPSNGGKLHGPCQSRATTGSAVRHAARHGPRKSSKLRMRTRPPSGVLAARDG